MVVVGIILLLLAITLGWWTWKHKVDVRRGNNWRSARWLPAMFAALLAIGGVFSLTTGDGSNNPAGADGNPSATVCANVVQQMAVVNAKISLINSEIEVSKGKPKEIASYKQDLKTQQDKLSQLTQVQQQCQANTDKGINDAVVALLTVKSTNVDCPTIVKKYGGKVATVDGSTVVQYNIGALQGVPPRLWSDALSTPFVNTDPQVMLGEIQAEFCTNPHEGATFANQLANMQVAGVNIVELNPWLQPFMGGAAKINNVAASYVPLLDVKNPTKAQKAEAVKQNIAWQGVAEKLGTMVTRFQLDGVVADTSVMNYHLDAGGLVVGGMPPVAFNTIQESLPALRFSLTVKGAPCGPLKVIGFNTGDKRPEEFAPPTCQAPPTPTVPVGPGPTTSPPGSTPTTGPPVTTVPQTTVPCGRKGCDVATTTPPPPVTVTPTPATTQPSNGGQGDSGDGSTNTTLPPTTVAPSPAPPTTSAPVIPPPGVPGG